MMHFKFLERTSKNQYKLEGKKNNDQIKLIKPQTNQKKEEEPN